MRKKLVFTVLSVTFAALACFSGQKAMDVKAAEGDVVVVLDPGHDSLHTGANANGVAEEVANMKIALACKTELENYSGVTVYLTHDTLDCPYPDLGSRECNYARIDHAAELGASLVFSIHNNAGANVSGYEIYYPNSNYIPEFNGIGEALAAKVSEQLSSMGLNNRGMYTRDSDEDEDLDENFYPDGSRADYYNIIRNSKYHGFVGMITEHAYVSNAYDASLLSDDDVLNRMGIADATAIAQYYNLSSKSDLNGLALDREGVWRYFVNGEVDTAYTGMACNENGWFYIVNGTLDWDYTGMACNENGWFYFVNGALDWNYTGMACNEYGWWYISNGALDCNYTGMAYNAYGDWYMSNGVIDYNYTGMAMNEYGWWYISNGALDWNYTGMAMNEYGWWYISNGALDRNYTGLALNEYGWWYISNGALDWNYTGMAYNAYGDWYISNGVIDYNYTGMACNAYGWWYMSNGALDWNYTGMAMNEYGWWYISNGALDRNYTGLAMNEYGWWYISNGALDVNYTGLAENRYGMWYVNHGGVDLNYSGEAVLDGKKYIVNKGYAVIKEEEQTTQAETKPVEEKTTESTTQKATESTTKNAAETTAASKIDASTEKTQVTAAQAK